MIIDGKKIAEGILERLKTQTKPSGFFGAVLVGSDPASVNFLKQKEKVAQALGIEFRLYQLPLEITTDELRKEIERLARPKSCGGFIVQLPLPQNVNRHYVLNAIPKEKDADCLSESALGAFYTERSLLVPPSVGTLEEILQHEGVGMGDLRGLKVVMVGAGFLIGKPIGFWLQNKVSELVVLDASVKNLHEKLRDADIVVSGAGQAGLFNAKDLKDSPVVIDFGFNTSKGKIAGDFDSAGADEKGIRYTKTPGGTGPILVAKLFENFYALTKKTGSSERIIRAFRKTVEMPKKKPTHPIGIAIAGPARIGKTTTLKFIQAKLAYFVRIRHDDIRLFLHRRGWTIEATENFLYSEHPARKLAEFFLKEGYSVMLDANVASRPEKIKEVQQAFQKLKTPLFIIKAWAPVLVVRKRLRGVSSELFPDWRVAMEHFERTRKQFNDSKFKNLYFARVNTSKSLDKQLAKPISFLKAKMGV